MKTVILQGESITDLNFLINIAKEKGIKASFISDEEKEDFALGKAIEEGMKTESVSKSEILKALRK